MKKMITLTTMFVIAIILISVTASATSIVDSKKVRGITYGGSVLSAGSAYLTPYGNSSEARSILQTKKYYRTAGGVYKYDYNTKTYTTSATYSGNLEAADPQKKVISRSINSMVVDYLHKISLYTSPNASVAVDSIQYTGRQYYN